MRFSLGPGHRKERDDGDEGEEGLDDEDVGESNDGDAESAGESSEG